MAGGTFGGGDGTEGNPYLVEDADDLDAVRYTMDAHYLQIANIDLTGVENWNPIGYAPDWSDRVSFTGVYDGDSHQISNLTIERTDSWHGYMGSFWQLEGGIVRRVRFIDVDIRGYGGQGVIAGQVTGGAVVEDCFVTGTSWAAGSDIGGITGYLDNAVIRRCLSHCSLTGSHGVAGITPYMRQATVENCCAFGAVEASGLGGGLVGWAEDSSTIENCLAAAPVTVTDPLEPVGGLVGQLDDSEVVSSYYDSEVSGQLDDDDRGKPRTTEQLQSGTAFNPSSHRLTLAHRMDVIQRAITWPVKVDWGDAGTPVDPSPGETDLYEFMVLVFEDQSETWYGKVVSTGLGRAWMCPLRCAWIIGGDE